MKKGTSCQAKSLLKGLNSSSLLKLLYLLYFLSQQSSCSKRTVLEDLTYVFMDSKTINLLNK